MKKNQRLFFFIIIFIIFLLSSGSASALEINYPNIPGLLKPSECVTGNCLPVFVSYWVGILIYLAGIISLISFVVGAIGLISPNIEAHIDAKDRMKGSILGLVLTVAAVVILRTINPVLVTPSLTPLPGVQGVFYFNDIEKRPVPISVSNTADRGEELISGGFNKIIYDCTGTGSGGAGPALLLWKFKKPGLENGNNLETEVTVHRLTCDNNIEKILGTGSFKMAFETAGIYFYMGANCTGYSSLLPNTFSQDSIMSPFRGNMKSFKIVNDQASDISYGIIFHNTTDLSRGGLCSEPMTNTGCLNPGVGAYAADIFILNKDLGKSGDGVTFYSEPFGEDRGAKAGFYPVPDEEISLVPPYYEEDPGRMTYLYTNVVQPEPYKEKYKTFRDKPESIDIKGSYLVGLYSEHTNGSYCQTFTKSVKNLLTEPFLTSWAAQEDFSSVYIIPIK